MLLLYGRQFHGRAVSETTFFGTEYTCCAKKGFLRYATHFQKLSVLKTGFSCTEWIFGTGNGLLQYGGAVHIQKRCTGNSLSQRPTHPAPIKLTAPIKAKRPTDSRRPTLRLCTKT